MGTNDEARSLYKLVTDQPELGFVVTAAAGRYTDDFPVPIIGTATDAVAHITDTGATGTIVAVTSFDHRELTAVLRDLAQHRIHTQLSSGFYGISTRRIHAAPLAYEPLIYLEPPTLGPWQQWIKRAMDLKQYLNLNEYMYIHHVSLGLLLTSLIINCTAAVGLVASMVLLWFRFPGYVKGKHLEQQTELARQVQMDLMPPSNSIIEKLDFAAECVPAWQVGGDFYDVFANSEGRIAVCLGDVSGKGLPASVVVGLLLGAVRASDWMKGGPELEAASKRLNELLRTRTSTERFASLFWCFYEPDTKMLRYINAGHLPPMIAKRNGNGALQIERLEDGGPVLGVIPAADYHEGEIALAPGDLIVMYSDGVVEATDHTDDQFGEDRLMAIIQENSQKPAAEIRDEILRRVREFLKEEPPQDDLTLVVARIRA